MPLDTIKTPLSNVGLVVYLVKFKTYFETEIKTFNCLNLTDAKKKLVRYLADSFQHLSIDFPDDLLDFEYIWFQQQYVKSSAFNYKVFYESKWVEPWDNQQIYADVLEQIIKTEINNDIDYEELYGEPTLNELYETTDKNQGFYSNDGYNIDDEEIDEHMDKDSDITV